MTEIIQHYLSSLPEQLQQLLAAHWEKYQIACQQQQLVAIEDGQLCDKICQVWLASDFVAQWCCRYPQLFHQKIVEKFFVTPYSKKDYFSELEETIVAVRDFDSLSHCVRTFRNQHMVRIIWRDLLRIADLSETMMDLSNLADVCIDRVLNVLYQLHSEQYGLPLDEAGRVQKMLVIAVGKLGTQELNLSSDVDLIFCYPKQGMTDSKQLCISNEQFFVTLGQRLIKALSANTADGFVFRVDMRLRPDGDSGMLATSFVAMSTYYQEQGREWERYALIKARIICGEKRDIQRIMDILTRFVYRKYVDYGAIEALREIKQMISKEVKLKKMAENVKLGSGGIREVEFIGQVFQLVRGGQEPGLQNRTLTSLLNYLKKNQILDESVVSELQLAYRFLRDTEHRLQAVSDRQTQTLPSDELACLRLAYSMGFKDWDGFYQQLRQHRHNVHQHFEKMISNNPSSNQEIKLEADLGALDKIWCGEVETADAINMLAQQGFADGEQTWHILRAFHDSQRCNSLRLLAQKRLNKLMPMLLASVAQVEDTTLTLTRIIKIIEAIVRRSTYLSLLQEHPSSLIFLVKLCSSSGWLSEKIARYPLLLEELLEGDKLYAPQALATLENKLRQLLLNIPEDDLESQMDTLRRFKLNQVLRVAAADISGHLPLMKVSDHLTDIACLISRQLFELVWKKMVRKYGRPQSGEGPTILQNFAIIAYGKLGGIELGYDSDLDLVFLHGNIDYDRYTDGDNAIPNSVFYTRLAQRIIHMLSIKTAAGALYEVDTRLRPSGDSGLIVSNIDAFADYQLHQAWTWEHQALVRARVLTNSPAMEKAIKQIRYDVLTMARDEPSLREQILEMRQKMRAAGRRRRQSLDLKQTPGGITDIEFIVQYAALRWAHDHPKLIEYTDNIRILEALADEGLMSSQDVHLLCDAYRHYREIMHHASLQNQQVTDEDPVTKKYCQQVMDIWQQLFDSAKIGES